MARLDEIEKEIRSLSAGDRTLLLPTLIADLADGVDEDVDQAWLEEAQRRHRELAEGRVATAPAEEVFERARSRLKQ